MHVLRTLILDHLFSLSCLSHPVFTFVWLLIIRRSWHVGFSGPLMYVFDCTWNSRRNRVQFFISHLASWLRTRRFSEVTFRPSGATNHWKNTVNRDFPTLSRTCVFFLLTLSLFWSSLFFSSPFWLFPPLLVHLSILLEVWLLNSFDKEGRRM